MSTPHSPDKNTLATRYERAQTLMQGIFTKNLVQNATVFPIWIEDSECFWYERELKTGKEYRLVNAQALSNKVAFDHEALAAQLAEAVEKTVDANDLPITQVDMGLNKNATVSTIHFRAFDQDWHYDVKAGACTAVKKSAGESERLSPDGKQVVFRRDHNLWLRDVDSEQERPLTQDGENEYVYGAPGSAWGIEHDPDPRVQAIWSPDSTQLFTVQRDTRQVKTLPIVHHVPQDGSLRPTVEHMKVAFPGDDHVETLRLVAIDIQTGRVQAAKYHQIPTTRNSYGFFSSDLGWWATDNRRAYFVDVERDYKAVRVVEFDTHTGATRILFEETTDTHINLMLNADDRPTFRPLPESNELLWFSERSGWAHLYLYDLETGALKNTVTQGNWLVREVVHIDTHRREVFVQTAGRVSDRDPYYRDLCRVHLDTGDITTLAASDHEYWAVSQGTFATLLATAMGQDASAAGSVSFRGNFAVVTRSRADEVPVSLLLDRNGKTLLEIETTDITGLPDNWRWPEPVKLLAADNKTDLYGLMFRPSDFSPDQAYPVIAHVFSNPEIPFVSKGAFINGTMYGSPYLDATALAELGFIVVQIDSRGTACRHKAFHDESYGWIESACNLDDIVSGIHQLAERYSYLDLNRVGITSQCSGGPGGVQALLKHPDFFNVGVTTMFHDSRLMGASMWGDKFEGLSGPSAEHQYPEALAENLQGKLLIMHGMLDFCGPAAAVFRLVEALHKANKDFDLILLPNLGHAPDSYFIRRAWDYFVTHLLDATPPKEFKLASGWDLLTASEPEA